MIVLCIVSLAASAGIALSAGSLSRYEFNKEKKLLVRILEGARASALHNVRHTPHGVHVEANRYVLFEGGVYDPTSFVNEVFSLAPSIALSAPSDPVFEELSGDAIEPVAITLRQGSRAETVTIEANGRIDW